MIAAPFTCSGLAYSGVIILASVTVSGASPAFLAAKTLAMPKSSNFTWPSMVTKMLPGFKSRCTTRC